MNIHIDTVKALTADAIVREDGAFLLYRQLPGCNLQEFAIIDAAEGGDFLTFAHQIGPVENDTTFIVNGDGDDLEELDMMQVPEELGDDEDAIVRWMSNLLGVRAFKRWSEMADHFPFHEETEAA